MTSPRAKGRAKEKAIEARLTEDGWMARCYPLGAIFRGPGLPPTGFPADVFGCDVEAVNPHFSYTLRVQASFQSNTAHKKRQVEQHWQAIWSAQLDRSQRIEVWTWGRWEGRRACWKRWRYRGGREWVEAGWVDGPRNGRGK